MVKCSYGYVWALLHLTLLASPPSNGKTVTYHIQRVNAGFPQNLPKDSLAVPITHDAASGLNCTRTGFFPVAESSRNFYRCDDLPGHGLVITLCSCPPSTTFNTFRNECNPSSAGTTKPECVSNDNPASETLTFPTTDTTVVANPDAAAANPKVLNRQKRFIGLIIAGIVGFGVGMGVGSGIGGVDLTNINSKIDGIEGALDKVGQSVLRGRLENAMNAVVTTQMIQKGIGENRANFAILESLVMEGRLKNAANALKTQNLAQQGIEENRINFEKTNYLLSQSMLENKVNAARTQGLITKGQIANEMNFVRVQGTIREVKNFFDQKVNESVSQMEQGFQRIHDAIDRFITEPVLSEVLTSIKGYIRATDHLFSLPKEGQEDELKRRGGYIKQLENTNLQNLLLSIIQENLAIPRDESDNLIISVIDMLVDGLQIYAKIQTSLVTSHIFLAGEALEDRDLDDFDTYMTRAISSISIAKIKLGTDTAPGLCDDVLDTLNKVKKLQLTADIEGLPKLLEERELDVKNLKLYINDFFAKHTYLKEPGMVNPKLNFTISSMSLPFGPWKSGTQVSYACQLMSEKGLSEIGEWSVAYPILDKGNPVVYLPSAGEGQIRFVYRKFSNSKPELVDIVTDQNQDSFRDITRDLINAVSEPNEDLALLDVESLLDDGADVNGTIEKNITPLHNAAAYGNVKIIQLLLNRSADLHAKTIEGETALHLAAMHNHANAIEFLINKGSIIESYTKTLGWTPLHIAAANDNANAVRTLVAHNAYMNARDNTGLTPLHLSTLGSGHTMDILLGERDIDVNVKALDGQTPLHHAASSSNPSLVKKLMEHADIEINTYDNVYKSPLHYAAIVETKDNMASLIQHGASPFIFDLQGSSPIHFAALYGKEGSISTLIHNDQSIESAKNWDREFAIDLIHTLKKPEVSLSLRNATELVNDDFEKKFMETTGILLANVDCTNEVAGEIVTQSEENCLHIGQITNYIDVILSKVTVPLLEDHYVFTQAVINYNTLLQNAQGNALSWKHRQNILRTIEQAFLVTKEFEGVFEKRYKTMQRELGLLPSRSAANKLEKLIAFLKLVKDDASKVHQMAASAKQICSVLLDTTNADIEQLQNSFNDAKTEFSRVENQKIAHQPTLKFFKDRQDQLESDIKQRKASIPKVTENIYRTYKELRAKRIGILEKIEHLPTRRFATTIPSSKSDIISELIIPLETIPDKEEIERLTKIVHEHKDEVQSVTNHVSASEDTISQYQKLVFAGSVASKTNQSDFDAFKKLDCSLKDIVEIAPSAQSAISGVINTLEKIENAFSVVTNSFGNMITTGSTPTNEDEAVNSINTRLSRLHCYWRDTGVHLADLKECSKNFYFVSPEQNLSSSKC